VVDGLHVGAGFDGGVGAVAVGYDAAFAFEALAGLQGGSLCGYLGRGQYIAGNEKGVAVGLCGGI